MSETSAPDGGATQRTIGQCFSCGTVLDVMLSQTFIWAGSERNTRSEWPAILPVVREGAWELRAVNA
jgi:hypothetical protein